MGELPNTPIPDPHVPQTQGLQIDDHRLSTSCTVVERPDHHCGDDLVFNCSMSNGQTVLKVVRTNERRRE